jgi:type IV pilus assembly protein PilM
MPRAVGLDIGSRLLKLVELRGSAKSFKIHKLVVRPFPEASGEDPDAARADLVRSLFAEHRLPGDDVCASSEAGTTVFRDVTMPYKSDDQIEKTVRFEAENHLHGRAIEDVVVNWVKTGETREGSQILVMAAPKQDLAKRLGLLRRAGVDPASVDLDVTALFTACDAARVFEEHPSCIVLDVGARTTCLLLVDGGQPKAIRAFQVGAEAVGASVAQDLSLPAGEGASRALRGGANDPDALLVPAASMAPATAESRKSVAELEHDLVAHRREDFVRKLQREIMRTLSSSRMETAPAIVLLCGGGSLVEGLPQALSEKLALPVEPLGLLRRLNYKIKGEDPALQEAVAPVAVGCALRLLGRNPLGVELRQEEYAPSNTFEVVRGSLALAVTLLVALLAGLAFVTKQGADRERNLYLHARDSVAGKAATILEGVEKAYLQTVKGKTEGDAKKDATKVRQAVPADEDYLVSVRNHLARRYKELEENLGLSKDIPMIQSATKAWREIYFALGEVPRAELGWFKITKMAISQSSASITVEMDDERTMDKVIRALNTNEYMKTRAKDATRPAMPGNMQRNATTKRNTVTIEIPFEDDTR